MSRLSLFDKIFQKRRLLFQSTEQFKASTLSGTSLGTLNDPFEGLNLGSTTWATFGSPSSQLFLSRNKICVSDAAAAVADAIYNIGVVAVSGDQKRRIGETFSFKVQSDGNVGGVEDPGDSNMSLTSAWRPFDANSNLLVWFDAMDFPTIIEGYGVVRWWNNKGTLGSAIRMYQEDGTRGAPYSRAAYNQLPGIVFDDTDYYYFETPQNGVLPTGNAASTIAAYGVPQTNDDHWMFTWGANGGTRSLGLRKDTGAELLTEGTTSIQESVNSPIVPGPHFVVGSQTAGVSPSTVLTLNGGPAVQATHTNADPHTAIHGGFLGAFGGDGPPVNFWKGPMQEVIVFDSALSTGDRLKLEGYLAWKWGNQALLPSNHRYKNGAPRTTLAKYNHIAIVINSTTNQSTNLAYFPTLSEVKVYDTEGVEIPTTWTGDQQGTTLMNINDGDPETVWDGNISGGGNGPPLPIFGHFTTSRSVGKITMTNTATGRAPSFFQVRGYTGTPIADGSGGRLLINQQNLDEAFWARNNDYTPKVKTFNVLD